MKFDQFDPRLDTYMDLIWDLENKPGNPNPTITKLRNEIANLSRTDINTPALEDYVNKAITGRNWNEERYHQGKINTTNVSENS